MTLLSCVLICICFQTQAQRGEDGNAEWATKTRQVNEMAKELLGTGFSAGIAYQDIWIRDFNTFLNLALEVNDPQAIKGVLINFMLFQQRDGAIMDGYVSIDKKGPYKYHYTPALPRHAAHKNTVETDQETSFIQAVKRYVDHTGDTEFLQEEVEGKTVLERMENALLFLYNCRYSERYGLIWGATTADWGDVQPENEKGIVLDEDSHLAIDIYDNAMLLIAVKDYIAMSGADSKRQAFWKKREQILHRNIRTHLWDQERSKFRPHIYLVDSPFPPDFDEENIYYHGGTAVAAQAGVLSRKEVLHAYLRMQDNMRKTGAASIGLTLYPAYPKGYFKHPVLTEPYTYQNGGDWTWFGARMVSQLARYGYVREAKEAIMPMIDRVLDNKDFHEWYLLDNRPAPGTGSYRGTAGVLWDAIVEIEKANK